MLAAGAARAVGVDPEVALVDLDLVALGQERRDDDLRERRVAAMRRVERRLPHEPVDAALGLEEAVGVLALDGDRRGLEPRLLPRARLDELGLEAAVGRPAQVHPEQHLGPVLRVGAARPGGDRDDRVARVVLAVEERLLLQPRELLARGDDLLGDLGLERGVELEQLGRLVDLALEALVALELAGDAGVLGRDAGGRRLVVPEPGAPIAASSSASGPSAIGVKGSHGPRRAGPRAPRAARRAVLSSGIGHRGDRTAGVQRISAAASRLSRDGRCCADELGSSSRAAARAATLRAADVA